MDMEIKTKFSSINDEQKKQVLTIVLDDSFIKADISPFKVYPDEKSVNFSEGKPIDITQTVREFRNGVINEDMTFILGIVIEHRFITSRQLWQIYFLRKKVFINRSRFDRLLEKMVNSNLLTSFNFSSSLAPTNSYKVFCAAYNGVRLYSAINKKQIPYWSKTFSVKQPWDIKRHLANNQLIISFLKNYVLKYTVRPDCPILSKPYAGKKICPLSQIECINTTDDKEVASAIFLVEVVRRFNGWEKELTGKLHRYGAYMNDLKDTQQINKYYLLICLEDQEQYEAAFNCYRKIKYDLENDYDLDISSSLDGFFTYDMKLLDKNYEDDLLTVLMGHEYRHNTWIEKRFMMSFDKVNWEEFNYISKITESESTSDDGATPLSSNTSYSNLSQEELFKFIKGTVLNAGLEFPADITKINSVLRKAGFDYSEIGYKRCKDLFFDLKDFFDITYPIPTKMQIHLKNRKDASVVIDEYYSDKNDFIEHDNVHEDFGEVFSTILESNESWYTKSDLSFNNATDGDKGPFTLQSLDNTTAPVSSPRDNIYQRYFSISLDEKKENIKFLHKYIYMKNRDMSATVLGKLTHRDEFSVFGWGAIIAFSFNDAMKKNAVYVSRDRKYLCFSLGIKSSYDDVIYLLADKSTREGCDWVLKGIATKSSKTLGSIINEHFSNI